MLHLCSVCVCEAVGVVCMCEAVDLVCVCVRLSEV